MAPITRASRAAQELLEQAAVSSLPVKVHQLAKQRAFVMRDPLPNDVSGMLIPAASDSKKPWIIVLNKTHAPQRQLFTLAHELGHIMLHQYTTPHADGAQRIRFRDGASSTGTDRDEIEANQFAAELLMPAKLLFPRLREIGLESWDGDPPQEVSDKLADLAHECGVSMQALIVRLTNLLQPA